MARRPFFTGDYGSALGRIDTRPIMEAGRAQGQMFAGLGAEAAKAIETYQLNKERQKEDRATIKSTVDFLKMQKSMPGEEMKGDLYEAMMDGLTNEDVSLRERAMRARQGLKNFTLGSQIRASQALANARVASAEAAKNAREKDDKLLGMQNALRREALELRVDAGGRLLDVQQKDPNLSVEEATKKLSPRAQHILSFTGERIKNMPAPNAFFLTPQQEQEFSAGEQDLRESDLDYETKELTLEEKQKESKRTPQFSTREEATASVKDLPPGFSATIEPFKDGFNVASLSMSAKEIDKDLPQVPGFPDHYIIGGSVYTKDSDDPTKLIKITSDNIGADQDRRIRLIDALRTPELQTYKRAMTLGTRDGNEYVLTLIVDGDEQEMRIPVDENMQRRIEQLDELENQAIFDIRVRR